MTASLRPMSRQRQTQRWTLGGRTMDTTMDTRWTLQKHEETYATLGTCLVLPLFVSWPRTKCRVSTVSIVCPSLCPSCVRRVSTKCPPCAQNLRLPIQMARSRVGLGRLRLRSHTQQTRFPKKWREFAYFLYISIPLLSAPRRPPAHHW